MTLAPVCGGVVTLIAINDDVGVFNDIIVIIHHDRRGHDRCRIRDYAGGCLEFFNREVW